MHDDWAAKTRAELLRRRDRQGVWAYRTGNQPAVEPTALACLGLLAGRGNLSSQPVDLAILRAADWLASMQRADGSLGAAAEVPGTGWPTAYALLLWTLVDGHAAARRRAVDWLLEERGQPVREPDGGRSAIVGHDPTLIGWPWIDGTHSWLEPTAVAIVALAHAGQAHHQRVADGMRLIDDRSLPEGGWNYGNRSVFGRDLRPQPGPTGLALVSLASVSGAKRSPAVDRAIAYLCRTLPTAHAPISLGWGVLGLRAWDACPEEGDIWLARAHALHAARRDATAGLGLLLLAHQPGRPFTRSTGLTGATRP